MFRLIVGLPLAAAVTAALFVLMSSMIREEGPVGTPVDPPEIKITSEMTGTPPQKTKYQRPDAPKPPPFKKEPTERQPRPTGGEFVLPEVGPGGGFEPGPIGNARPIIKIPPQYPEQCRSAGVEGSVIVRFDVTDAGEVVNVHVISSDHRCFDRAVIKTVSGWKYPPERRTGVTETFTFVFTEE